jgi:hypothetical protein
MLVHERANEEGGADLPDHNGQMRLLTLSLTLSAALLAQNSDDKDAIATVQKTFDGMAAHDASMIRATMLPDALLYSIRSGAAPVAITAREFVTRIIAAKGDLLERFTSQPTVMIRGHMAQVWGEYEFLRDAKFTHCGVDSVSLFKTNEGWKIAAITYTVETTGCPGH